MSKDLETLTREMDELAQFASGSIPDANSDLVSSTSSVSSIELRIPEHQKSLLKVPNIEELNSMSEAANVAIDLETQIDILSKLMEQLTAARNKITTQVLPKMFAEAQVSHFTATGKDGKPRATFLLKPFVNAKLPEDPTPAFNWVEKHGDGSIIKNEVTLAFDRTDAVKAKEAMALLEEQGFGDVMSNKQSIHNATLKSYLKKLLEKGEVVPLELFGAYIGNVVNIKVLK